MPLSEHEQRLLEQIEQALYAEDPKFASLYKATDLRSHYRRRVFRAVLLFIAGLGLLLAGVITALIALGVAGFVVMLLALSWLIASAQRMNTRHLAAVPDPATMPAAPGPAGHPSMRPAPQVGVQRWLRLPRRSSSRSTGPRRSFIARLEERFQRRFEG